MTALETDPVVDSRTITAGRHKYTVLPIKLGARTSIKPRIAPALLLGGHSVSAPPDPISNSAVKPDCANGTNAQALEE